MIECSALLTRMRCSRRWLSLLLLPLLLAMSACVSPRLYRAENIQKEDAYTLAYVEFDDQGELWSPSQMSRATELIRRTNEGGKTLVVIFVHGWQNNASSKQEQEEGKSLHGFKQFLTHVSETARQTEGASVPVIGVYLAWRGKSAHKPFHGFTFWNRRRAATRIASSGAVIEVLSRVIDTTNQNPESKLLLIGHSFGGLLTEQALLQYLVGSTVSGQTGQSAAFRVDLVMLINPASPSLRAKQLTEVFARDRVRVYTVDAQGKRYERPLMISVTSRTDRATRNLYPMGTALGLLFTRFRTYGPEFCSPAAKQRKFYLYTAGHNKILHSHVVTAKKLPDAGESKTRLEFQRGHDPATQQETFSFNGLKHRFTIKKKRAALNDTPYWIMNVPKELIPNHSDIFGVNTQRLMSTLVRASGALAPNSHTELVRESGLRPLGLAVRSDGELVFAEQARRLYALPAGSSSPVFLSCIPTEFDPADSIGFFGSGDTVIAVVNRLTDKGGKDKGGKKTQEEYRTELLKVSLTEGGVKEAKPGRLAGSMRFFAAAGDPVDRKLYLATADQIYIADLTEGGRPEAKPLVRIDVQPDRMAFDSTNKRLFAVDSDTGRLYLVDLRNGTPQAQLVADGLGWPADVIVAPNDGRIYIADAKNKQVWRLKCEDVRCTKPEVFARHNAFRTPSRLAVAPDNTVWVADIDGHKIFMLGPDGKIRQTISSLAGETQ